MRAYYERLRKPWQRVLASYLLESENSRGIGKQESNPVELDSKKIALVKEKTEAGNLGSV